MRHCIVTQSLEPSGALTFTWELLPLVQTTSSVWMVNASLVNLRHTSYVLLLSSLYSKAIPDFACWNGEERWRRAKRRNYVHNERFNPLFWLCRLCSEALCLVLIGFARWRESVNLCVKEEKGIGGFEFHLHQTTKEWKFVQVYWANWVTSSSVNSQSPSVNKLQI